MMKSFLECKAVSIKSNGDQHQVVLHDGLDTEDEPYFNSGKTEPRLTYTDVTDGPKTYHTNSGIFEVRSL